MLAWRLARAGLEVVLLEAGPEVVRSEAVAGFGQHEDIARTYPGGPDQPRWGEESGFFEQAGPEPFGGVYEKLVGGTTWHWLGTCLRFLESDFRLRSRYGVGLDWPICLGDLEPYYGEAEEEMGVAGAFLPALPATYLDKQVAEAARPWGYRVEVLPAARNSRPYQGRPACRGSATCLPICPIGAKYDASVHVTRALQAGAKLMSQTAVTRVVSQGYQVRHLELATSETLKADHYVLACNAIETPRLLLYSGHPNGNTGRYLMGMAGQISQALSPTPVWPFRSPQVVSGLTQFRDGDFRKRQAALLISIGNDGWPNGSPPKVARGLIEAGLRGQALRSALSDHVSRQLLLVSSCEELPLFENSVRLSHLRDSRGLPRPRIHFKVGQYTQKAVEESVLIHARIFESMKATSIHHYEESSDPAHLAGTCRMGLDPGSSVVDANLNCHHWKNLSILGSAVFPTVGSAPPTLTVAALALRLADYLTCRVRQAGSKGLGEFQGNLDLESAF